MEILKRIQKIMQDMEKIMQDYAVPLLSNPAHIVKRQKENTTSTFNSRGTVTKRKGMTRFTARLFLRSILSSLRRALRRHGDGEESLGLADGARFLELDYISDLEPVFGIVGMVSLLHANPPLVLGMRREPRDFDAHRLVSGVGDNSALQSPHRSDGEGKSRWGPLRRSRAFGRGEEGRERFGGFEEGRGEELRGAPGPEEGGGGKHGWRSGFGRSLGEGAIRKRAEWIAL